MWQIHTRKIMIKIKKVDFFFKKKTCDKDEKNVSTSTILRNFMRIQELKKMKKKKKKKKTLQNS